MSLGTLLAQESRRSQRKRSKPDLDCSTMKRLFEDIKSCISCLKTNSSFIIAPKYPASNNLQSEKRTNLRRELADLDRRLSCFEVWTKQQLRCTCDRCQELLNSSYLSSSPSRESSEQSDDSSQISSGCNASRKSRKRPIGSLDEQPDDDSPRLRAGVCLVQSSERSDDSIDEQSGDDSAKLEAGVCPVKLCSKRLKRKDHVLRHVRSSTDTAHIQYRKKWPTCRHCKRSFSSKRSHTSHVKKCLLATAAPLRESSEQRDDSLQISSGCNAPPNSRKRPIRSMDEESDDDSPRLRADDDTRRPATFATATNAATTSNAATVSSQMVPTVPFQNLNAVSNNTTTNANLLPYGLAFGGNNLHSGSFYDNTLPNLEIPLMPLPNSELPRMPLFSRSLDGDALMNKIISDSASLQSLLHGATFDRNCPEP